MKNRLITLLSISLFLTSCASDAGTSAIKESASKYPADTGADSSYSEPKSEEKHESPAFETAAGNETSESEIRTIIPEYTLSVLKDDFSIPNGEKPTAKYEGDFELLSIDNEEDYPLLASAVSEKCMSKRDSYVNIYKGFIEFICDGTDFSLRYDPAHTTKGFCLVHYIVTRCDDSIFSYADIFSTSAIGREIYTLNKGINIDSQTGELLALDDICNDIPALIDLLAEKMNDTFSEQVPEYDIDDYKMILTNIYGENLMGFDEFREGINFALSADGIMFLVNDYELFSIGNCDFTPMVYSEKNEYGRLFEIMGYFIPFSEAEGMFSEKYL